MAAEAASKKAEREALRGVIQQWNANRLDLFELSEPNEDLEFHGVMRFYFQDSGQKVATKCIRVASDATTQAVIETLIEKFRPDMRMLSVPEYALYEIHENGEERKLGLEEKPLLVQLNWHIDDREGRFLLRRIDDKTNAQGVGFAEASSFRRKLSKREKKQMKKQEKLSRLKSAGAASEQDENAAPLDQNGVAEKLYTELPETSFTRSISNPEAVMRRRRQQKLERKLQQFRSKDGGPDTGGTLKIYGEALCKDVPYKTLLLSIRDSAAQVVREMLAKYGLEKVDPQQYCLVQVNGENANGNAHQEYILDDDECPLAILMNHPSTRGSIMFHVRRRPADYVPRKRKKKPAGKWNELEHIRYEDERLPFLLELNPDGTDISSGAGVRHRLQPNVTEVGSERPIGPQAVQAQTLTLTGPTVMPRHCVIAFTENIVTLTPCSRDAHTYVNNQRIHQTTILQNGAIIKFGRMHTFRFIDPAPEERIRQRHDSGRQMDYSYDRRSPDSSSQQELSSEKYRPGSGMGSQTPNGATSALQSPSGSNPPSPTKSAAASPRSPTRASQAEPTHNYETTFDLDGNVETASLSSSRDGHRLSQYERQQQQQQPRGTDPILPAVLEFLEETEETFLHAVITDVEPSAPQFKLAPTYTLYLAARYRASTHYRPELQPTERAKRLTVMLANVATMIQRVIQERYMDASSLALWLANGSELLHMLKSDRHVGAFSTQAQDILADAVHTAFDSLVRCVSLELAPAMSQFMADADEPAKEAGVLQIFSNSMALLRRCRVNAALTIQLFSHLFHAINATAFNALVSNSNLCVRWFGRRLKARLNALETWAERQGLELASQCHLATIMQATHLLQAPKYNTEELAALSATCFKLNSLQVQALLQKYQPAADEPRLPAELIESAVRTAMKVADGLAKQDGREIRLEEEPTLNLALLLPDDGYSCEVIRGVPPGLAEFLAPLQRDGLCRMAAQPTSSGYWTIYMIDHNNFRSPSAMSNRSGGYSGHMGQPQSQPEIQIIKLHKSTSGMGLSIVAAKGAGQDRLGIYIKSVVAGGAADADGRLSAGDQLLKVDGQSLVGITQEKAAEYLVRTGPIVTLEVAKQGAIYHGLATLLSQPSPIMTRASKARPKSEHFDPPRIGEMAPGQPASSSHSMGNLLSVPRHSAGQVYHEQYVDNWDPQPGASIARVGNNIAPQYRANANMPYRNYIPAAANSPYQAYQQLAPVARPNTLLTAGGAMMRGHDVAAEVYPNPEMPYEPAQARLGYWPGEPSRQPVLPIIREPTCESTFLTIPSQYTECYPHGYASAQVHANPSTARHLPPPKQYQEEEPAAAAATSSNYGAQYGYYSDDKTELVFPAVRSHSQDYLEAVDDLQAAARTRTAVHQEQDYYAYRNTDQPTNTQEQCQESCQEAAAAIAEQEELDEEDKSADKACSTEDATQSSTRDNSDSPSLDTEATVVPTPKLHTVMPELNLDLSGLNSSDVSSDESNGEKCWKSPEDVRLGCGRVAALAKHFSQLGEAGLIKFKSRRFAGSRQFMSEPDIASPSSADTKRRTRASIEKFKSETELLKSDKSVATTPEKEWSMILLDIQAKGTLEYQEEAENRKRESKEEESEKEEEEVEEDEGKVKEADDKSSSKLSLAEQEQIIEQLKEFANLDNVDAPLFIPSKENGNSRRGSGSDKETMTDSTEGSIENIHKVKKQPRTLIAGSVKLEQFRNHSLPTILSTLNVFPQRRCNGSSATTIVAKGKVNSLSKYWSLKDLASSDELDSNHTSNDDMLDDDDREDSPGANKYVVFPTCSRVVSAPEISDDFARYTPVTGITIKSTISFGRRRSDESATASSTSSFHSTVRLSKSTSDISRDAIDGSIPGDCDDDDDDRLSKSWEKLNLTCNKKHSRCYARRDNRGHGRRGNSKLVVVRKKAKSDLDVSERKPTPRFERGDWVFRDISQSIPVAAKREEPRQQQRTESHVGTEGKLQHEVFNPGYSRASSSNSVTPPVQPPPMPAMNGATSLRSRSSHNLHDPSRAGTLPPSGLSNRQQSSPNLNPSHPHGANNMQSNEAERFYQNLSVYRNQEPGLKQHPSPPQSSDDRSPLHVQKPLSRGSESTLHRGSSEQGKERPMSAYVPQGQQPQQPGYPGPQGQQQGPPARSQSSRDIIRQEAKLSEMQEEVRRRELRGGPAPAAMGAQGMAAYRNNTYNPRAGAGASGMQAPNSIRNATQRPIGSTPNLGPTSPSYVHSRGPGQNYGYLPMEAQQQQYNQYAQQFNKPYTAGMVGRPFAELQQQYQSEVEAELAAARYGNGNGMNRSQTNGDIANENPPARPSLPQSSGSPPPPVPNTMTHPLFTKQMDPSSSRYTASMQDPPRGGYYPTTAGGSQQPRQYQFSATNPWQREEKEKQQARRREAARQWRDQQIAELSALPHRSPQQEEQLRALQLERDFQKRAEEAANQQDDDEEGNDVDNENASTSQRIQGLLRSVAAQDQQRNQPNNQVPQPGPGLNRSNATNQSGRGALSPQPVGSQIQMTNVPIHTASSQQGTMQNNYGGGQNVDAMANNVGGYSPQNQNVNNSQSTMSPSYGSPNLNQQSSARQKASMEAAAAAQANEERERQRRMEELKRRQSEFDENQRRRQEEEARQQQQQQQQQQMHAHQQQMQQMYQQHQSNLRNQHQLHPGMLRLDNLVIEEPNSPNSQSGNEAPPPPERGSSYAVMSQQSALRSNTSTTSNSILGSQPPATMTKRVSFHDPNANTESPSRNNMSNTSNIVTPSSVTMDTIREDPNNFINDAEMLLASPKTPEGPGGIFQGATPGVIGAQEVYKDPRTRRLAEKQRQQQNSQIGAVPEKLSFKEKMKMFAMETGEDGTPRDKVKISRAQREIDNIGSPLSSNNNN
ncbi:uncharacterized protein LOC100122125 isoform X3 [Nasonia vitripennis]|nr:uncharacterized protein LOC100122125 isoform X3 [Nasonia vitripennis]